MRIESPVCKQIIIIFFLSRKNDKKTVIVNIYRAHLVDIFGGRKEHRRFVEVAHRIEFRSFARRMIKFVDFLATRGGHFSFGGSPLFVSGLSFGSL